MKLVLAGLLAACSAKPQPVVANGKADAPADARLVFARQVYTALADGDAKALMKLADPAAIDAAFDCPDAAHDPNDPRRAAFERAATRAKGLAIEIVGLATATAPDPGARHVAKGAPDGLCTAKAEIDYQTISLVVRVRRGDGPTVEQRVGLGAIAIAGRWYLHDLAQTLKEKSATPAQVLAWITGLTDEMCACAPHDAKCADAIGEKKARFEAEHEMDYTAGDQDAMNAVLRRFESCLERAGQP